MVFICMVVGLHFYSLCELQISACLDTKLGAGMLLFLPQLMVWQPAAGTQPGAQPGALCCLGWTPGPLCPDQDRQLEDRSMHGWIKIMMFYLCISQNQIDSSLHCLFFQTRIAWTIETTFSKTLHRRF